ncbi:Demethylrebeccamycin-D-glucose O-methyltransferase [Amycolatopsis sp. YIM 10]|nr:Demethylrebeccamycin-D-glucose O-methyltransferase [Amycolatopsis sp. YIM 10]
MTPVSPSFLSFLSASAVPAETGGMGISAQTYDRFARWALRWFYRRVAEDLSVLPPAAKVLDIGCGTGVMLAGLARRRPDLELAGIDVAPGMIAVARRNAPTGLGIEFGVGDVVALPHAASTLDVVVTTLSMHHWPDRRRAVADIARTLKPGGRLYVYDFRFTPAPELTEASTGDGPFTGAPLERTHVPAAPWFPLRPFARFSLVRDEN